MIRQFRWLDLSRSKMKTLLQGGSTSTTAWPIHTPEAWWPGDTGGFPDCLLGSDSILRLNTFLLCMLTYFPQAILSVFGSLGSHQIPVRWLTLGVSVCLSASYKHKPYQARFGLLSALSWKVWAAVAIFRARKWTSCVRWMTGGPMAFQSWGDETSSLSFDFENKHAWQAAAATHKWPKIAEWRLRGWQRQKHASGSWNCWYLGLKSQIVWTWWGLQPQVPRQAQITSKQQACCRQLTHRSTVMMQASFLRRRSKSTAVDQLCLGTLAQTEPEICGLGHRKHAYTDRFLQLWWPQCEYIWVFPLCFKK